MAEQRVTIEGTYNNVPLPVTGTITTTGTVTANQGTPGPVNAPWPIEITDGSSTVAVISGLNALRVAPGLITTSTTLSAVTINTTGTTVAAGSAYSNWSAVAVATGAPTAGTLTLELSHDNTSWVSSGSTASITAAGNYLIASTGRPARYARCSLTSLAGTITLTVTMTAAG